MADRYEYYNTGFNSTVDFYGAFWLAQTFTPSVAHRITSVKLLIWRFGLPGTITVSIRETDSEGHPTGADLCSGTTDGDTLTDDLSGEWREIALGAGYNLDADTKYAIVVRALTGDGTNRVIWRCDLNGIYTGGNYEFSGNSGTSWNGTVGADLMFEEWGEPPTVATNAATGINPTSEILYEYYNTGFNSTVDFFGAIWLAQTFTPSVAHRITSVKLLIWRFGLPGTITVSIRETDSEGHPTGADLCSGTTDGDTLTDDLSGEWREIALGAGYNLDADTKYAIVVRALTGDGTNRVIWRCDLNGIYTGGNYEFSGNSGTSWNGTVGADLMFEEWGEPPTVATNVATSIIPTSAILNGTLGDDLGEVWDVRFQWGRTEDYGNDTPWQPGFHTGDTFTQLINTLEPGKLYHFRAQAKNSLGTVSGTDVTFWTQKPSVGKAYAFSRELHLKRATDVVNEASIAASAITTLADCVGINLIEVPSSLTLTVEATYDAAAAQGIKIHVRTSLTNYALGTHSGADDAAVLTDAEAHFVVNELVGLTIKNLTDGSSGLITANTGTTVTATLVGGTDNDWDKGDAYIIEGAGYDTEDWDSFIPAFSAGSSIRQTEHYDVDPVYLKVLVENLDEAKAVTDVKIIMAVGA